jgi:hypothetical protein
MVDDHPDQSRTGLESANDESSSSWRSGLQTRLFAACWGIAAVTLLVLHPLLFLFSPILLKSFPSELDALLVYTALFFFLAPFAILASGSCCTWLSKFVFILIKLPFVAAFYFWVFSFQMVGYMLRTGWNYGVAGVQVVVFRTPPLTYFWRHWTFQSPRFGWESIPQSRSKMSDSVDGDEEHMHYKTTSQLCEGCLGIVENSGLIVGSSRVIVPREEIHVWSLHIKGVEIYGEDQVDCHLCNILWYTMNPEVRLNVANGMNFGSSVISPQDVDNATVPDAFTTKQEVDQVVQLNVKISEDFLGRWYEDRKRYIQACGPPGLMPFHYQSVFLLSEGMCLSSLPESIYTYSSRTTRRQEREYRSPVLDWFHRLY